MSRSYDTRVQAALQFLEVSGFPGREAAPPWHRWLWGRGARIAPPPFAGFFANCLWTVPLALLPLLAIKGLSPGRDGWGLGLSVGVLMGAAWALSIRLTARRAGLPRWRDFGRVPERS